PGKTRARSCNIVGFQALSPTCLWRTTCCCTAASGRKWGGQSWRTEAGFISVCSSGGSKICVTPGAPERPELRLPAKHGLRDGGRQQHPVHRGSRCDATSTARKSAHRPALTVQPEPAGRSQLNHSRHLPDDGLTAAASSAGGAARHPGRLLQVAFLCSSRRVACTKVQWQGIWSVGKYSGSSEMRPFAFRTHAHALSRAIVGYRLSPDLQDVQEIGRASPQWAQAFYPARPGISIRNGDYLAARCVYDATGETQAHHIGSTHNDEMCNFYIMFSTPAGAKLGDIFSCGGGGPDASTESRRLWRKIPQDSLDYLPSEAPADAFAYAAKATAPRKGVPHPPPAAAAAHKVAAVPDWPRPGGRQLGQVQTGRVFVFHAARRVWGPGAFDPDNRLSGRATERGRHQRGHGAGAGCQRRGDLRLGRGVFFMPHSLHIDAQGNFWITDVGLHQPADDAVTSAAGDVFVPTATETNGGLMRRPGRLLQRRVSKCRRGVRLVPHSLGG
uniref:Cu2_monoox_C domain-containing protein n=1 Tax=Macrostomum lignano TaxID=282301 RepID=A0A1I8FJM3_9PLAT